MNRRAGMGVLVTALMLYVPMVLGQNIYEFTFGNYIVNYNTFPSNFLDKNIAKTAGIRRSDSRGVITIAVRQHQKEASDKPVKASVSGTATNLIGQISNLHMSEIRDGSAIYYMGDFTIVSGDQLTFNISVLPQGETRRQEFNFTRQF